jgi:hypothetical protein
LPDFQQLLKKRVADWHGLSFDARNGSWKNQKPLSYLCNKVENNDEITVYYSFENMFGVDEAEILTGAGKYAIQLD